MGLARTMAALAALIGRRRTLVERMAVGATHALIGVARPAGLLTNSSRDRWLTGGLLDRRLGADDRCVPGERRDEARGGKRQNGMRSSTPGVHKGLRWHPGSPVEPRVGPLTRSCDIARTPG